MLPGMLGDTFGRLSSRETRRGPPLLLPQGVAALGAGDIVVTTTSDGRTFTWNASSGEKLHELESFSITVTDSVFELQSFPKDGRVLTINSQSAIIWDALDGSPLHELFTDAGGWGPHLVKGKMPIQHRKISNPNHVASGELSGGMTDQAESRLKQNAAPRRKG